MRADCDPVIDRSCLQLVQAGTSLKIQAGIFRLRNQQAATFQQTHDTPAEGVEQLCQFIAGGTASAVKGGLTAGESVNTVQKQHVQVNIQIESRAKTLNECHRSGAGALRELEPTLAWDQNPRYNVANKGADFMDNYGWNALGLSGSNSVSFGVLLLGPGVTYPLTSYESEGIFLVIGGSPEWISDEQPWRRVNAGDVICRPWGGAEGKRPGKEPMLALYAWMYR